MERLIGQTFPPERSQLPLLRKLWSKMRGVFFFFITLSDKENQSFPLVVWYNSNIKCVVSKVSSSIYASIISIQFQFWDTFLSIVIGIMHD